MNYFHVYVNNFPSFYSAFSVLHIFIISFSTSVLFSKRRINVNLVDLVKSFPTSFYLQKSASIQPRTSLSKFGGKFNSLFIRVLTDHTQSVHLVEGLQAILDTGYLSESIQLPAHQIRLNQPQLAR